MSRIQKLKLVLLTVCLVTSVVGLVFSASSPSSAGVTFATASPSAQQLNTAYIAGAVVKPGAYEISRDTTVGDLISRAGGFLDTADKLYLNSDLNLTDIVTAGQHLNIPFMVIEPSSANIASSGVSKININTATVAELDTLPGIGPSLAANIVSARPYNAISDLKNVKGIGDSKYSQIESLVSL